MSIEARQFIDEKGVSPFEKWFERLDNKAAAKITTYINRVENGNFSNVESVGAGVFEIKIDFGPGYRVYFGKEAEKYIILLGGGHKKGQQKDISLAKERWQYYKKLKY